MKQLHSRVVMFAAGVVTTAALAVPAYAIAASSSDAAPTSVSDMDAPRGKASRVDAPQGNDGCKGHGPKFDFSSDENLAELDEELRMTRDLYRAIAEHYEASEDSTVFDHFLKRGNPDGPAAAEPGTYENADVQKRYDALLKRAKSSLDEAYKVAIEVEEHNISAIDNALKSTDSEDAKQALERIREGAKRHLDRFTRAANGETVEQSPDPSN